MLFEEIEIGHIQTVTGAGGGVIFTPTGPAMQPKNADFRVTNFQKATVSCQVVIHSSGFCLVHLPF